MTNQIIKIKAKNTNGMMMNNLILEDREFYAIEFTHNILIFEKDSQIYLSNNQYEVIERLEIGGDKPTTPRTTSLVDLIGVKPQELNIKF